MKLRKLKKRNRRLLENEIRRLKSDGYGITELSYQSVKGACAFRYHLVPSLLCTVRLDEDSDVIYLAERASCAGNMNPIQTPISTRIYKDFIADIWDWAFNAPRFTKYTVAR